MQEEDDIPEAFICPITQLIMKDPVTLLDGHTYEREAIEKWFNAGHATSPLTNRPLGSKIIKPNYALRNAIEDWLKKRPGLINEKQLKKDWELAVQLYLKEAEHRQHKFLSPNPTTSSYNNIGLTDLEQLVVHH